MHVATLALLDSMVEPNLVYTQLHVVQNACAFYFYAAGVTGGLLKYCSMPVIA